MAYTKGNDDNGLEALYFNYGRYLLISSSRTPDAPANLQGIWSKDIQPPWSSNYTTNINVQMNYWPVEECNLSELHQPLLNLIEHLYKTGSATAKEFYGAKGWVVHHNSDIWALSNPVGNKGGGDPKWANWSMGANWLVPRFMGALFIHAKPNLPARYGLSVNERSGAFYISTGWCLMATDIL